LAGWGNEQPIVDEINAVIAQVNKETGNQSMPVINALADMNNLV